MPTRFERCETPAKSREACAHVGVTTDEPEIDASFNFSDDSPAGKDPDSHSPTLRRYHQTLWSKELKSGDTFALEAPSSKRSGYLILTTANGRMVLGSDTITNSYTRWTRPKALANAVASLSESQQARYLNPPYSIGSAMVWPVRSKDRPTINQARGTRPAIADRMDLTLECIRRHYAEDADSPLADVLCAYGDFFALFDGFREFVDFFHFQDLVTDDYQDVRFFLPLQDFARPGVPRTVAEYVSYREAALSFIAARNRVIHAWVTKHKS